MMTDSSGTLRDAVLVARLLKEARAGRPFALAGVLATRGSMPRGAGARMALLSDGSWLGTVGGGRVEQMAMDRCRAVLEGTASGSLEWLTHAKTGMACGGDALLSVRRSLGPEDETRLLADLLERGRQDEPSVIDEDWSDERRPRVSLTSVSDIDPGDLRATIELPLWDEARRRYSEPIGADPMAYVFGAGHVGQALCPVLAGVGFRVTVFDDRAELATTELFPRAERVVCGDFGHVSELVHVTRRDYVVVMTHGHVADLEVLRQVAPAQPAYVGCIGSRGKAAFVRRTLVERGVSDAWAQAVHLPVGEDILAVTPDEIAVSIAAEMIRCRAELRPRELRPHAAHARKGES
ncbi:XdhC family protein [Olsenella sp. HMSC062G07]|uniref:XdhC family protein n=1 Tax=Olsenella sp. HMSC062G07 TaxID=1739330 RepID=UPI000AF5A3D5|nr:XdhC/CoxI family protein [Olsenella sp. HMSC062G07]